jgi:predicted AAA+ superfamily ATPase
MTQIQKDLKKKIVLLVGPRQSGKTYLAKEIAKSYNQSLYLNYDNLKDRHIITDQSWLNKTDLLIFDELHKMPQWKNYIKGVFDTKPSHQSVLVTGSARLDIFDKIGDSLAGRYYGHRLLPLSLAELKQSENHDHIDKILDRGGFPEPFLTDQDMDANRWRLQYVNSLLSTDIFEFDTIHNLKAIRLVFDLLRARVGSPVSYKSIAEDVGVAPSTVKKYIQILEAVYVIFSITPYSKNIARSLLKEPKIYFFDTPLVTGDEGAKLENLVAVSLLKSVYAKNDQLGENGELHYLRTKDGQEVDFVISQNGVLEKAVEVKQSDSTLSKHLKMFHDKYAIPSVQIVKNLKHSYQAHGIEILKADDYLKGLYL